MSNEAQLCQPFRSEIFQPLADNEIRVLRLQSAHNRNQQIHCDLWIRPFNEASRPATDPGESAARAYEAVSWCWGEDLKSRTIQIHIRNHTHPFYINEHLESCLKALRHTTTDRFLWIDAICIDQENLTERNAQVAQMDRVYGGAKQVAIWIGDGDDESKLAFDFMRTKILPIWGFDAVCEDKTQTDSWAAFLKVMSRPWFSRRWVIQEIALGREGTLYCGMDSMKWQDFADAVSLFVHVESATHRLSDVMKTDQKFFNLPDFFGDVHTLGAALLVDATTNLFRRSSDGKRQPRMSLEHLISKYSLFAASQPRDTIYAFLSISKDAKPQTIDPTDAESDSQEVFRLREGLENLPHAYALLKSWFSKMTEMQSYKVNYELPVPVVYSEFIQFSIERSLTTDATRALDIICRPWARRPRPGDDQAGSMIEVDGNRIFQQPSNRLTAEGDPLPSWIPDLTGAPFALVQHPHHQLGAKMYRKHADSLVGLPSPGERNYSAAGSRTVDFSRTHFKARLDQRELDFDSLDGRTKNVIASALPKESRISLFGPQAARKAGMHLTLQDGQKSTLEQSVSWKTKFKLLLAWLRALKLSPKKTVSSAQHAGKQTDKGMYYSMLVEGFILDEIGQIEHPSPAGDIPYDWAPFGGWDDLETEPPEEFWRTLVADRGPHGQNALTFYPRACKEALSRLNLTKPNPLKTEHIISEGGCTIVAEFLRRVQSVIWNRRLMRTKHLGHLGLSHHDSREGDLICVLYGCSVPVVLRRVEKSPGQMLNDVLEDMKDAKALIWRNYIGRKNLKQYASGKKTTPRLRHKIQDHQSHQAEGLPKDDMQTWLRERLDILAALARQQLLHNTRHSLTLLMRRPIRFVRCLAQGLRNTWFWGALSICTTIFYLLFTRPMADSSRGWAHMLPYRPLDPPLSVLLSNKWDDGDILIHDLSIQLATFTLTLGSIILLFEIAWSNVMQRMAKESRLKTYKRQVSRSHDPRHHYKLMGECYVHQMMDGEAINWQARWEGLSDEEKERRKPMVFELR